MATGAAAASDGDVPGDAQVAAEHGTGDETAPAPKDEGLAISKDGDVPGDAQPGAESGISDKTVPVPKDEGLAVSKELQSVLPPDAPSDHRAWYLVHYRNDSHAVRFELKRDGVR